MLRGMSLVTCLFVSLFSVWSAEAQAPAGPQAIAPPAPPSVAPDGAGQLNLELRLKLVQELYGLDADQVAKLRTALTPLIARQQAYDGQIALTLRRLSLARRLVADSPDLDAAARSRQLANFDSQYYKLVADGPLSMAGVAKAAEQLLAKDQVAPARERIKTKLGARLAGLGEPDPYVIDQVLTGPVPVVELPQPMQPRPVLPPTPQPAATDATAQSPNVARPVTPQPPVVQQPPVEPVKPRVPAKPAPPDAEWPGFVEKSVVELKFTPDQKTQAETVLTQVRSRAKAYREQHAADYQNAEKTADAGPKAEALRKLNGPIDLLYDELTLRVESLASLEQLQKAGRPIPTEPPPAPLPQVKPPEPPPKPAPPVATLQPPTATPKPAPPTPVPPPTPAPQPPAATPPPAPKPEPVAPPPAPKPPPTPAPPVDQWSNFLQKAATDLAFTPEQQKLANQVLENCQTRAQAHHQERKADYEAAEKLADPTKKSEALRGLDQRMDLLYQEMTERIESLATMEQLKKAGRAPRAEEPPAPQVAPTGAPGGLGTPKAASATPPPAKPADGPAKAPAAQPPKP